MSYWVHTFERLHGCRLQRDHKQRYFLVEELTMLLES